MGKVAQGIIGGVAGFFTGGPVGAVVGFVGGFAAGAAQEKREEAAQRSLQEQRRANAINNAQQNIARQRQIRQALAEERVRRAQLISAGFSGGPEGIGQNITGDVGSAIGAARTQQAAAFGISRATDRAASFNREAQSTNSFDTIASIAGLFNQGLALGGQGKGSNVNQFEGVFDNLFGEG